MPAAGASDSVPPLRGGYVGGYKQMNIKESEFEWLRGYLQREESTQKHSMGEASDSSETGSTTDMTDISFEPVAHAPVKAIVLDSPIHSEPRTESRSSTDPDTAYKRRRKVGWTSTEDLAILASARRLGTQWNRIAAQLPGRTADAVRNRWHRLQKSHSLGDTEEGRAALDALLIACGFDKDWVPPNLEAGGPYPGDEVCIKGSDHGRAMWTAHEDQLIEEGVRRFGLKWRQIAASLPGRSDSSVRNRWMRLQKEAATLRAAAANSGNEIPLSALPATSRRRGAGPVVPSNSFSLGLPPLAAASVVDESFDAPIGVAAEQLASSIEQRSSPLDNSVSIRLPHAAPSPPSLPAYGAHQQPAVVSVPVMSQFFTSQFEAPPTLPTVAAATLDDPSQRPESGLKRERSFAGAAPPLGASSPLLGFDLVSFVEAVQGAIDEAGNVVGEGGAPLSRQELVDVNAPFRVEVDEPAGWQLGSQGLASPLLATASSHGTSHAASEAPSSPLAAEEGTGAGAGAATPRPLLALSAVLVGLAALSIGVSIARRR